MSLYNLRSLTADTYMICKFSDDFEVESTYTLTAKGFSYTCDCPANNRAVVTKPCRHKLMMPALLLAVDTDQFYDHDTGKFCTPLGDLLRPEAKPVVGEALRAEVTLIEGEMLKHVVGEAVPSPTLAEQASAMLATPPGEIAAKAYAADLSVGHSLPAPSAPIIRRR